MKFHTLPLHMIISRHMIVCCVTPEAGAPYHGHFDRKKEDAIFMHT